MTAEAGDAGQEGHPESGGGLSIWRVLLGLYALTLVASWIAMWLNKPELAAYPREGFAFLEVPAMGAEGLRLSGGEPVQLAYIDAGPQDAPVILAMQGSPGSGSDFRSLIPRLEDRFRIIAPDMPGFAQSTRDAPDLSVRAHAGYCLALLDHLGIDRFHALGFSMGGGVGLELIERVPARVQSLTLLAAIGVIELELLGSHTLNHGIHGLQLAAFQGIRWLVPHFGAFDRSVLGIPYARNFYDTDQRRLRPILETMEQPLLIVHGEDDFLVPLAAAEEHRRIVPQAELEVLAAPASHFLPWSHPAVVSDRIAAFLDRVEAGAARTRSSAEPARIAAALEPFDTSKLP
ncbi:MAG: alpha/beta hydrolase, partial [Planctomycetota bacterium]